MPPKKKESSTKKLKKVSTDVQEEITVSHSPMLIPDKKIPKKPFFRTIRYSTLEEVKKVQVKLWKLKSCFIYFSMRKTLREHYENASIRHKGIQDKGNHSLL